MKTYAITYTYAFETSAARDKVRPAHIEFLKGCFEAGQLLVSGPVDAGAGALLVISAADEADALAMMNEDPFAKAGLIADRGIRRWDIFFGKDKLSVPSAARK